MASERVLGNTEGTVWGQYQGAHYHNVQARVRLESREISGPLPAKTKIHLRKGVGNPDFSGVAAPEGAVMLITSGTGNCENSRLHSLLRESLLLGVDP